MKHGVASTYRSGCRCDACTDAQRDQQWRDNYSRQAQLEAGTEIVHGYSGYTNWRCRCEICTAANSARCRRWYAARAASP